jgi:hypothetical protein
MGNSSISGNKTRRKRWEFGGPGLHYSSKNCHHPSGQPPVAPWIKPRTCDQPRKKGFAAQGFFWWRKFHYLAIKKRGCEPYKVFFFFINKNSSRWPKFERRKTFEIARFRFQIPFSLVASSQAGFSINWQ